MKQISILLIVAMMLTVFASCTIGKYEEESKAEASSAASSVESKVENASDDEASSEQSSGEISADVESSKDESSNGGSTSQEVIGKFVAKWDYTDPQGEIMEISLYYYLVNKEKFYTLEIAGAGRIPNLRGLTDKPLESYYDKITRVTIREGITKIGSSAFADFTALEKIELPSSLTHIASGVFANTGLEEIVIPSGVEKIEDGICPGCNKLISISVDPENKTYSSAGNCIIEKSTKTVVQGCKTSNMPTDGSVTAIGKDAFSGPSVIISIRIPDVITSIGRDAFSGCSGLRSITLPESVTYIDSGVFRRCSALEEVTLPSQIKRIKGGMFDHCSSLKKVVLPEGIEAVEEYSFADCPNLKSINLPEGLESLGYQAFINCNSLTSLTLPSTLQSIGGKCFYNCNLLKDLKFAGTDEQWDAVEKGAEWNEGMGGKLPK